MASAAAAPPTTASGGPATEAVERFEAAVERTRRQSRAVLLALVEIERRHPDPAFAGGHPLTPAGALVRIFERSLDAARRAEGVARARFQGWDPDDDDRTSLPGRFAEAARALERQERSVRKFWGQATGRHGAPPPPPTTGEAAMLPAPTPTAGAGARLRFRGAARAGFGTSSFEQPEADPGFEESTTLLDGRLDAEAILADGTRVNARLSRETRVERREISLSDVGVGVSRRFEGGLSVRAGVGRSGYSEELDKRAGYGETLLHANAAYAPGPARVSLGVNRRSRSFDEDDPLIQNFDLTSLQARAEMSVGDGTLKAGVTRTDRDGELDASDYTILNPHVTWISGPGGTEAHASLERFDAPDPLDADNDRIKLLLKLAHGTRERGGYLGPEVLLYRFADRDEAGYADYGLSAASWRREAGASGRGRSRWRAYFRKFESDDVFDFVAFSGTRESRPRRSGFLYGAGLSGKVLVDGNDFDELGEAGGAAQASEILGAIGELIPAIDMTRDPHLVDAHLRFGWSIVPDSPVVRSVEITPSIGHVLYVDTERDDLQGKADELAERLPDSLGVKSPLGDDDFLWRNTINRARIGARLAVGLAPVAGASVSAALQYDVNRFYNADPVQSTTSLDFSLDGRYPLRPRLLLEGRADLHKASFGDGDSERDFDRTEIALFLRYLFNDLHDLGLGGGS